MNIVSGSSSINRWASSGFLEGLILNCLFEGIFDDSYTNTSTPTHSCNRELSVHKSEFSPSLTVVFFSFSVKRTLSEVVAAVRTKIYQLVEVLARNSESLVNIQPINFNIEESVR